MSSTRTCRRSLRASTPRFVEPLLLREEAGLKVLECHVDGYPRPDIRWEKDGRPVGRSRRVHMVRSGDMCLLQIRTPQADDYGQYSCVATNIVGTASTHIKLGTSAESPTKSLHVNTVNTLSPTRTAGFRSRSMDRSKESVNDNKNRPRSRSASRDNRGSRQDVASSTTKSKLATFTNSLWRKNASQSPQKREISPSKKVELSKSMEDCRKIRNNFLNKVKIPDIFVNQKQYTLLSDDNVQQSEAEPLVTDKNVGRDKRSNVVKANGNALHGSLKQRSVKIDPLKNDKPKIGSLRNGVSKTEISPPESVKNTAPKDSPAPKLETVGRCKPRGKIASYLKLFESNDSSVKLKEPQTWRGGSLKVTRTDQNKDSGKCDRADSDSFFSIRRFMRRKSAEGGKKSPEVTDISTFVSHVLSDVRKSSGVQNETMANNGHIKAIQSQLNEKVQETHVLPDIRGFDLITDSHPDINIKKGTSAKKDAVSIQGVVKTIELSQCLSSPTESGVKITELSQCLSSSTESDVKTTEISQYSSSPAESDVKTAELGQYSSSPTDSDVRNTELSQYLSSPTESDIKTTELSLYLSSPTESDILTEESAVSKLIVDDVENGESMDQEDDYNLTVDSYKADYVPHEGYSINQPNENENSEERHCNVDVDYSTHESVILDEVPETKQSKEDGKEEPISSESERQIPSICVHEIPESEEIAISDDDEENFDERVALLSTDDESVDIPIASDICCEGKISYSSPLAEEKCEDFLQPATQEESLESDLQRVSSPIESPARIVKGPQSVTVLRGESVTLAISFTGEPPPNVLWMKGGRVLRCSEEGCRLSILEGREMSVVTVNDVTADDSGKYVVCVENEGGGDSRFASVAVVGFPEPPGGDPTASEFTDHSLVLSWYGSMYDGGSVVTGYQVEMCTLPDKKWHKVATSINTSCTVQGLSMGQRYVFRVRAENRYGVSHPSKESKVICLNDYLQYDTSSDEEPEDEPVKTITIENGTHFTERFDLKEEVGKGKFGTVYRCVDLSCGRARAAKIIRCLKVKDKEKVRQEIDIMSRLHHPKLMHVLAAFESGRNMIMVMEYISGGELFERVIADDFVLTEHDCILFMKQICDGVAYMHRSDVIHLDLKPENILCKTRTSHKIKIIDFGLARVYNADENLRILFGTPEFVAPEVLNYEPVSPASDMWSVGVICYVLLSGLSPFMGDNDTETFANITRGEMDFDDEAFDDISQDAKDFISGLLVKNIRGRMSAEECLKHPWLATARLVQKRPLSTEKLKRFIIRRKWQKSGTAIRALGRMVSLSRSSLGSSCDSFSPIGSPTSSRSRSRSSVLSRSETTESGDSVFSR